MVPFLTNWALPSRGMRDLTGNRADVVVMSQPRTVSSLLELTGTLWSFMVPFSINCAELLPSLDERDWGWVSKRFSECSRLQDSAGAKFWGKVRHSWSFIKFSTPIKHDVRINGSEIDAGHAANSPLRNRYLHPSLASRDTLPIWLFAFVQKKDFAIRRSG